MLHYEKYMKARIPCASSRRTVMMKTGLLFTAALAAAMFVGTGANALSIYPKFAVSEPAHCDGQLGQYRASFDWDGLKATNFKVGGRSFDAGATRIGDENAVAFGDAWVALVTYAFPAPGTTFKVDFFAKGATDKKGPAKGYFACK